jgi:hypothetical protein
VGLKVIKDHRAIKAQPELKGLMVILDHREIRDYKGIKEIKEMHL